MIRTRVVPRDFRPGRSKSCRGFLIGKGDEDMKVKMCGMKNIESAKAAEAAGAAFIGFIFFRKSHRYVEPETAAAISEAVTVCKTVGVFVDEDPETVNRIAETIHLDYVQLHGHEDADYARQIDRPVIKAYRYGDGFSAEAANAFPAEIILLDSFRKGMAGGTGEAFAWREAAEEAVKVKKPLLIAGGIAADNVREAFHVFHPYGFDISGSLEENREKSPAKIRAFMDAIRQIES